MGVAVSFSIKLTSYAFQEFSLFAIYLQHESFPSHFIFDPTHISHNEAPGGFDESGEQEEKTPRNGIISHISWTSGAFVFGLFIDSSLHFFPSQRFRSFFLFHSISVESEAMSMSSLERA